MLSLKDTGVGIVGLGYVGAKPEPGRYDAIVVAVAHKQFLELGAAGIRSFGCPNRVIFDIKHVLPKDACDGRF